MAAEDHLRRSRPSLINPITIQTADTQVSAVLYFFPFRWAEPAQRDYDH